MVNATIPRPTPAQIAAFYHSWPWRRTRTLVKERDGHACRSCGSTYRLQVDHITELAYGGWPYRLDPTNLVTLCHRCHRTKGNQARARRHPTPRRRTSRQW